MKWFLSIFAVLSLGAGMTFAYLGHDAILVVGVVGFVALLVAANLDRISEFKASGTGIVARTREVVERAENAITELQILAEQVATLSLSLVKRQGRLGGYTDDEQDEIRKSVLEVLTKVGVAEKKMPAILKDWHRFTEFDYAHGILGGNHIPDAAPPAVMAEWKSLHSRGIERITTPDEIRTFLLTHNYITQPLEELLTDYAHYRSHRVHRRPEVWRDRANWRHLQKT